MDLIKKSREVEGFPLNQNTFCQPQHRQTDRQTDMMQSSKKKKTRLSYIIKDSGAEKSGVHRQGINSLLLLQDRDWGADEAILYSAGRDSVINSWKIEIEKDLKLEQLRPRQAEELLSSSSSGGGGYANRGGRRRSESMPRSSTSLPSLYQSSNNPLTSAAPRLDHPHEGRQQQQSLGRDHHHHLKSGSKSIRVSFDQDAWKIIPNADEIIYHSEDGYEKQVEYNLSLLVRERERERREFYLICFIFIKIPSPTIYTYP
jgi:hypothetical protein